MLTNTEQLNTNQVLFKTKLQIAAGRKKENMETWYDCQLDKYKQHILMKKMVSKKRPWIFFQVLTCLPSMINAPTIRVHQNFELVNFLLLTSSWLVFYPSSPYRILLSTPEKTKVVPSLQPLVSGAKTSTSAHVCVRDFEPQVFLYPFRPCYSASNVWFI